MSNAKASNQLLEQMLGLGKQDIKVHPVRIENGKLCAAVVVDRLDMRKRPDGAFEVMAYQGSVPVFSWPPMHIRFDNGDVLTIGHLRAEIDVTFD